MDDVKLERKEWAPVVGEAKAVWLKKKKKICFNHKASEKDPINAPKVYRCYLKS
jgi:hypothetical protein